MEENQEINQEENQEGNQETNQEGNQETNQEGNEPGNGQTPEEEGEPETEQPSGSWWLGLGSTPQASGMPPMTSMPPLTSAPPTTEEEPESDEEAETIPVNELDVVKLGRQGEHLTQQVVIDCSTWLTRLPGCTLMIAAIRAGENTVYLPTVSVEDGVITWDIQSQDTARGGWGRGEVRAMKDGKIKKSVVFRTRVEPSLEGSGSAPITPPDWVQQILDSAAAAQAAATAAAASAAQAAASVQGLAGWSLTRETDETVTIDYNETEE